MFPKILQMDGHNPIAASRKVLNLTTNNTYCNNEVSSHLIICVKFDVVLRKTSVLNISFIIED